MREHAIRMVRVLLEGDAQVQQALRHFKANSTPDELVKLLRIVRRNNKILYARAKNWPYYLSGTMAILLDTSDKIRCGYTIQSPFNHHLRDTTASDALDRLAYTPITTGIHSHMSKKEVDDKIEQNKQMYKAMVITAIDIPSELEHYYKS